MITGTTSLMSALQDFQLAKHDISENEFFITFICTNFRVIILIWPELFVEVKQM